MTPTTGGALLLTLVALVVLAHLHRRAALRAARDRAVTLDEITALVDAPTLTGRPDGFPELSGTLDGHPVRLRVIVDALTLRKLPVLWLEVVQRRALPVAAPVNLLRRPTGTEHFSPDGRFDHELAPPPECPRPVRVSTTDPERAPDPRVLAPATELLHDPRLKELGLGRGGVRAVWLVAEADQGSYRLGRRAVFGPARVAMRDARALFTALTAVGDRAAQIPTRTSPTPRSRA